MIKFSKVSKLLAASSTLGKNLGEVAQEKASALKGIAANTIRITRLRLLFIAAKVVKDQNRDKIKYSIHDARTPAMVGFLKLLDAARSKPRPWAQNESWPQRFALAG